MEEWGPWIEHDGKGCPCVGQYAMWEYKTPSQGDINPSARVFGGGKYGEGFPRGGKSWRNGRIIRYRIRKPRALQELRELVENLPVREDA